MYIIISAEKLELTRPTLASKVYGDKMNKLLPCKPVDFFTQPVNGLVNSTDPDLPLIDVSTSSDISLRSEKSNDQNVSS